ncbi:cupin domain-containing protein [Rhizobium sp. LjRoot30]|uniref:cupin domain-containing protein n=1 Tax=Rhizobium sp. LjRoot30 TaxID=3342320 RepID=UPI003ED02966
MSKKPIVNIADLDLKHWVRGQRYESADASFGKQLGLTNLGIGYSELPPGKMGCPFHNHYVEDEMFIVLEGTGEYRFGAERHPIRAGDVLGAPAGGPETAHHIINTGDVPLKYFSISTMVKTDIVTYPDSGKFLTKTMGSDGYPRFHHIGREQDEVDYWHGEKID